MITKVTILAIITLLSNLLYAGTIFGFASLQLMLESDGVFSDRCGTGASTSPCRSQLEALALIYTLGSTSQVFVSFPNGILIDNYGPTISTIISGVFIFFGLLLFAISPDDSLLLISLGAIFIGIGGSLLFMTSFLVGFIVRSHNVSSFITASNCMMDGSTAVFLVLYLITKHFNVSRYDIFIAYTYVTIIIFILLTYLWYICEPLLTSKKEQTINLSNGVNNNNNNNNNDDDIEMTYIKINKNDDNDNDNENDNMKDIDTKIVVNQLDSELDNNENDYSLIILDEENVIDKIDSNEVIINTSNITREDCKDNQRSVPEDHDSDSDTIDNSIKKIPTHILEKVSSFSSLFTSSRSNSMSNNNVNDGIVKVDYKELHKYHWFDSIKTKQFVWVAVFGSFHQFRSTSYMGIVKNMLADIGDEDHDYLYTTLFSAIVPLGFIFIKIISKIINNNNFVTTFNTVTYWGILYGILAIIPILPLQVITFLVFCFFRSFFYTCVGSYINHIFGPVNAGRVYGTVWLFGGMLNIFLWPALLAVEKFANGNLLGFNIFLLLMCLPLLYSNVYVLKPILNNYSGSERPLNSIKEIKLTTINDHSEKNNDNFETDRLDHINNITIDINDEEIELEPEFVFDPNYKK